MMAIGLACLFGWSGRATLGAQEKLRLIIETDAPGGDPDDEGSLVRFFLYMNEWDVEGLIGTRSAAQSRTGYDGKTAINNDIDAYEIAYPNLIKHASGWPNASYLRSVTKQCYSGTEGRDLVIAAVDKDDPRPIWYTNWGTNEGNTTALKQALDYVKANRTQKEYEKFIGKIQYVEVYNQNHLSTAHRDALPFYMDTFWPDMDGGRWYHRWEPLTKTAGGFDITNDVKNNHGPLGAKYTITKEGDTPTFMHLIPNGLNVPGHPNYGSWSGRYAYGTIFSGCRAIWACNQRDTWNGSAYVAANRDNTLKAWAVHIQNDFKVRADWCVATSFASANHPPKVVLNGDTTQDMLRFFAAPGTVVSLDATGTSDPDGNQLTYAWRFYKEAGTYTGSISIGNPSAQTTSFTVPADANGKDIHVILQVTDNGSVPLTRYRRILIRARNQLKIMPLGDSLTDGSHNGIYAGSYRINLEDLMNANGWSWDFVGSKQNGANNGLVDQDHEGWIGYWTKDAPVGQYDISSDINLDSKLVTYNPDIVLLLIGANDCIHGTSSDVAAAPQRISELIAQIRTQVDPSTEIILATLPQTKNATYNSRYQQVNAELPEVVAIRDGQGMNVSLVPLYSVINPSTDLGDTVHFNASGSAKVSQVWFNAMQKMVLATASVPTAPTITTQPASKTVTEPATATFSVVASGSAPLSYQWQKNGSTLVGATGSSYTTPATTTANSGSTYRVVVSNSAGSVTSNSATLTVNAAPPPPPSNQAPIIDSGFTATPNPVVNASTTSLFVTAHDPDSGPAALTFTWSKTSGPGTVSFSPNSTTGSSSTTATFSASGSYTLKVSVSDSAATVSNSITINVTLPAPPPPPPGGFTVTIDSVGSGKAYQTGTLAVGVKMYIDRTYTYGTAPAPYAGNPYILTANDDKSRTETNALVFSINADAIVYVGYDKRATPLPTWLSGWTDTGAELDGDGGRHLYAKTFTAGQITLGGNRTGVNNSASMYVVVVVPTGGTPPPPPGNAAPTVDAGTAQSITLPATVSLNGTISEPENDPLTTVWTKLSGPGTVTFGNAAAVDTTAAFSVDGSYVLQLSANDGHNPAVTDTVTITVNAATPPPPPPPSALTVTIDHVGSGKTYLTGSLAVGSSVYIDRSYTFSAVPAAYLGQSFILTSNSDKTQAAADFLTFTVNQNVIVYVAYDVRASQLPTFLASWTNTGLQITTTDVKRNLFSKTFTAGSITLGGNLQGGNTGAQSNYNVIIVPVSGGSGTASAAAMAAVTTGFVTAYSATDSDGDGLLDVFELQHGLNPYSVDSDGDGTVDEDEYAPTVGSPTQIGPTFWALQLSGEATPRSKSAGCNLTGSEGAPFGGGWLALLVILVGLQAVRRRQTA